eukprot:CAMPEP_0205880138 /NCGR_PEP_ID=MMETSP1083-20121108/15780_1 /ASSEMBLY_ACC=CAM_ASM_000430 /TAXON_ID=97485 /ORGANISM="Prymnesium parvum, Strain Texoma1" /LENGTH=135 /DNA_ID=CAMNT_0053243163 /DNA_START=59 /DNA_END=463 /DNA_ORIENTATION=+
MNVRVGTYIVLKQAEVQTTAAARRSPLQSRKQRQGPSAPATPAPLARLPAQLVRPSQARSSSAAATPSPGDDAKEDEDAIGASIIKCREEEARVPHGHGEGWQQCQPIQRCLLAQRTLGRRRVLRRVLPLVPPQR